MIFDRIIRKAPPGTVIPKPEAKSDFIVKGIGNRRGEKALIYFIPNNNNPQKPYQKGVTVSEFDSAFNELTTSGSFTKDWFKRNLPKCNAEGDCNFTTIGGLFTLLGEAVYQERGIYSRYS